MSYIKIICGKLYDGINDELKPKQQILIENDKIIEVGAHISTPSDCEIIDLSDFTVTPGMIDAHVHASFLIGVK